MTDGPCYSATTPLLFSPSVIPYRRHPPAETVADTGLGRVRSPTSNHGLHKVCECVLLPTPPLPIQLIPLAQLRHVGSLTAHAGADLLHRLHQVIQSQRPQFHRRRFDLFFRFTLRNHSFTFTNDTLSLGAGLLLSWRQPRLFALFPLPLFLLGRLLLLLLLQKVADRAVRGRNAEVPQVAARVAVGECGQRVVVEVGLQLLLLQNNPKDGDAVAQVWQVHHQATGKAADDGLIQIKRSVCSSQHKNPIAVFGLQAIPVGHKLVLYLPHRLVLAHLLAATQHTVYLVDEHHAGGNLVRQGKQGFNVLFTLPKPFAGHS
mmetsp:Transcript_23495/g.41743  ORF Transcript_23495/g.41743 Transcript_23495/m.41743 type:complete len:318 (+) Transcript_23495:103-1056(+)